MISTYEKLFGEMTAYVEELKGQCRMLSESEFNSLEEAIFERCRKEGNTFGEKVMKVILTKIKAEIYNK